MCREPTGKPVVEKKEVSQNETTTAGERHYSLA